MRRLLLFLIILAFVSSLTTVTAYAADSPEPGFVSLFNGKNLEGWYGDTEGYTVIADGVIKCDREKGGNFTTKKQFANFILRFEFKLTPNGNNGLAIRAPRGGDDAYSGIELQILDDSGDDYKDLEPWQYHGSIYGVVPAKRGHLKPVGEWNEQEVVADGTKIKVILNGATIVDADLAKIIESGETADGKGAAAHPKLKLERGHLGFLGHQTEVYFRNIRMKELP